MVLCTPGQNIQFVHSVHVCTHILGPHGPVLQSALTVHTLLAYSHPNWEAASTSSAYDVLLLPLGARPN